MTAPVLSPRQPVDDRPRVLVADDNDDRRQRVVRVLGERYRIEAAADGATALASALAQTPDVILTGVMRSPLGGGELVTALRADPRTSSVPIIILTADAAEDSLVEASVAYSGESALSMLAHAVHDAVLLDIGLPDIDGYEVCRRVRADTSAAQPVMLALTGWGQEKDREEAAAAGFDAHLSKPADPDRLMAVLTARLTLARQGLRPQPATGAG